MDIAFALQYEEDIEEGDFSDDIFWSMQHIMHRDPRRRFTFGVTLDNTTTSVWFCCRQMVVVSEAFDFVKDSDYLLYFILSMCFANTTELGWDPTVTPKHINNSWQYDFKVGENIYRTTEELSTFGASTLRGRATRVYKANKLLSENELGPDVAIKDSWCNSRRKSEKQILNDVLEGTSEEEKKYFLTIDEEENVMIGGIVDDTENLIMRKFHFDGSPSSLTCEGLPPSSMEAPAATRNTYRFHPKIHRRTVFKEVGTPIYKLTSTKKIFTALTHVVQALEIMYKKQYVHRDVSIGNILVVDGQGKLSDLEYAKIMDKDTKHDVCAGTVGFIAIEAEYAEYQHVPNPALEEDLSPCEGISEERLPAFSHNVLHDLESVWWVAVWCLFFKIPIGGVHNGEAQEERAKMIFPQTLGSGNRMAFFEKISTFRRCTAGMYFENWCRQILNPFRMVLLEQYTKAEQNIRENGIDTSVFNDLHQKFLVFLRKADDMEDLQLKDLDLWKAQDRLESKYLNVRKRPASDSMHQEETLSKKAKSPASLSFSS